MFDFELPGWTPADEASADARNYFVNCHDLYRMAAVQHSEDGRASYILWADHAFPWDAPGMDQANALHIEYDLRQTFRFHQKSARRPTRWPRTG